MRVIGILLLVWSGPVFAQDFQPRAGDRVLDAANVAEDVVGRTHEFFDGGVSFFSVSGIYTYTYSDGGRAYGKYEVRDDGAVCSSFDNGFSRCDLYVHDGTRLVLITEAGDRFPVKVAR